MKYVSSEELHVLLVKAGVVMPGDCRTVTITLRAGEPARMECERFVECDTPNPVTETKRYLLVRDEAS